MTIKLAVQCSDNLHECVALPSGKRMKIDAATSQGYTISSERSVSRVKPDGLTAAKPISVKPISAPTYAAQLRALPEAINRQSAASALAADHNINSLPLSAAASLLRGLPTEGNDDMTTNTKQLSAEDHAMFKRRLELRMAALRLSASHDSAAASVELKKLNYAARTVQATGMSWGAAFTTAGLDARSTIESILKMGA